MKLIPGETRRRSLKRDGTALAIVMTVFSSGLFFGAWPSTAARRPRAKKPAPEVTVEGRVVKVSDGDTITVLTPGNLQVKVRLYGIDAPEKKQPFGNVCRELLASRVAGEQVRVSVRAQDRYGRSVGIVHAPATRASTLKDGPLGVNLLQVQDGCAWHYRDFTRDATESERAQLDAAESTARLKKVRIWSEGKGGPQAPWEFRRNEREFRASRRGSRGRSE